MLSVKLRINYLEFFSRYNEELVEKSSSSVTHRLRLVVSSSFKYLIKTLFSNESNDTYTGTQKGGR